MSKAYRWLLLASLILCPLFALAADTGAGESRAHSDPALDRDMAALKADVAELNAALFELEQDILFPPDTQLAVFISVDAPDSFQLDSIDLSVNDRRASSHLYTDQERAALAQGSTQRLYLGNIPQGTHRLTATLNGRGGDGKYFRKQQNFSITKDEDAERVELTVKAPAPAFNPEFAMKRW